MVFHAYCILFREFTAGKKSITTFMGSILNGKLIIPGHVFFYVKEPVHWTTSNILNLVVQPGFHRNSGDHFARHEGGGDQQLCCCN